MTQRHHGTLLSAAGGARSLIFFALWLVLTSSYLKDVPVGIVTAIGAAWISLKLLPPGTARPSWPKALLYMLRFLRESIVAGFDIARRAFDPRLPINPGFISYKTRLAPGNARDAFFDTMSLLPGTVPAGQGSDGHALIHALDVAQPIAEDLEREEAIFAEAFGVERQP